MPKVLVPLASGFEEIEAVTIVDVLRRASLDVTTASLASRSVEGAHGIVLVADCELGEVVDTLFDAVVLPGGMPGSRYLAEDERLLDLLRRSRSAGKWLAAICAAPTVLEAAGVLEGKRATCYPGHSIASARFSEERVVQDGRVITSRGPGTALEFSLRLVAELASAAAAESLRSAMLATA